MSKKIYILLFIIFSTYEVKADFIWQMPKSIKNNEIKIKKKNTILLSAHSSQILGKSKNNKKFEEFEIEGFLKTKDLFKPNLPYKTFLVSGENLKLNISKGKSILLKDISKSQLAVFQGEKCRCNNLVDQSTNSLNTKTLNDRPNVLKTYLGDFRGVPIYKIELSPIEIKGEKIFIYPNLEVEASSISGIELFDIKNNELNKKMLILYPPHFESALAPFIAFKKNLGFEITDVKIDQNMSFLEIKNIVHKLSAEKNISYLLVVGSEKLITTQYVVTNFEKNTPSDLELTLLGGEDDLIPDIFAARVSVNGPDELTSWVQKTISYESSSTGVPLKTIALASNEGSNPSDVDYLKSMTAPLKEKFSVNTEYFFQGNINSSVLKISEAIDSGADFINYIGHGSGFSWPSITSGEFTSDNLLNLRNQDRFPIVIDVACQNGRFQGEERFGESFVTGIHGRLSGAVAYYGGSVDISWDPPAIMAIGISSELSRGGENILGQALLKGQIYLMKNYSDHAQVRYNLIWYHLQGDPSLKMKF